MPKIENWGNLPEGIRQHLIDRMRDRAISMPTIASKAITAAAIFVRPESRDFNPSRIT